MSTDDASVSETASATDASTATAVLRPSVVEAASVSDTPTVTAVFGTSVVETVSASDSSDATITSNLSVVEAASATGSSAATAVFGASRSGYFPMLALSTLTVPNLVAELASAGDISDATVDYNRFLQGVECAAQVATPVIESFAAMAGVGASAEVGTFAEALSKDVHFDGVVATAECATFTETLSKTVLLVGVQANTQFSGFQRQIPLIGVSATAEVGAFPASTFPGPRTFFIAGVTPRPIPPGIMMLPTSDTVPMGSVNGDHYAVGSSQFYTVGQVYWGNELKTQGMDYQLVSPFSHIVQILDPSTVSGNITLVYDRWNIGVRAGFRVTSYPVPFAFTGTSIVAEQPPPQDQYFTVQFTNARPGTNPQTLFSLYPLMVDDMLSDHTVYDGEKGFQTYRPECYQVLDTTLMQIFEWTGSAWVAVQDVAGGTSFYVKTLRAIYENQGGVAVRKYTAGDGPNGSYPQAITYPAFGEGIGKNLLVDGFSQNARTQYPAAYQVCSTPGTYASVCQDEKFDYDFDFAFDGEI